MKQAIRILSRMKSYTALSLLGLIISLSGTVIISRYLHQEWTVDHFMPALDRTYIVCSQRELDPDWSPMPTFDYNHESQFVSPVEGQSEVECWTNVQLRNMLPVTPEHGETFYPQAISVDSSFTQVYPLEVVEGTLVLRAKGQCILSTALAARLFPGESAVGKTLTMEDDVVHTVLGVFRQPATKSSLRFDVANYGDPLEYSQNKYIFGLALLHEGADVEAYNERQPEQSLAMHTGRSCRYNLQPYTQKMAWMANRDYIKEYNCIIPQASSSHLWMLLFVAVLLLFVGLFNFVNLYAVMRRRRRHEMHVRRLFGASRWNIFCQLYAETFVLAALAMIGVWAVVELAAPLLGTYYNIEVMSQWKFDVGLSSVIIFGLPLISSIIPNNSNRPLLMEGTGVGLQFFISLALLNVSLYFMRQLHTMMSTDPGFRTEGLLSVVLYPPSNRESWTQEEYDAKREKQGNQTDLVQQRLNALPYLKAVTLDMDILGGSFPTNLADGGSIDIIYMTNAAARIYGLQMVEGEFPDSLSMDDYVCMANESAIKALGIKNRETDLVQFADRIWWSSYEDMSTNPPYRIVGVVRDFNPNRQSEPIRPLLLIPTWSQNIDIFDAWQMEGRSYLMDIAPGHEEDIIRDLKDLEKELCGTSELNYHWLSDQRKDLYKEDQRTARIFVTFSLLAIAVTCLGVLGLMMFEVRRRYREIALRKVHGATFRDIALLLSRRYLIVFAVAAVASLPVSLLVIHRLMASYTIHTSFAWWIPLASIALILALCALTLWWQVWRATRIRAYEVLKEE